MDIDLSTQQFCEQVASSFKTVSLETVIRVWHAIGPVVRDQMQGGKGVRLDGLGIFSYTIKGDPVFNLMPEFCSKYRVKQVGGTPGLGSCPTPRINLSQLCKLAKVERAACDKIYSTFISAIGKGVQTGRQALVSINKVAELNFSKNQMKIKFLPDFMRGLGKEVAEPPSPVRLPRARDRNPMTGDGMSDIDEPVLRQRERNPLFGEDESIDSRRPRTAGGRLSSARSTSSAGGGGLTAANLRKISSRPASGSNPRAIAAQALGAQGIINKVREKIVARGGSTGIRGIAKLLSIMDDNGDKRLSKDELKYGLRDYGIDLTPTELEQVFNVMDRDKNGFVDVTEFLVAIKGEMNSRRKGIIKQAFNSLDTDNSGEISVEELCEAYDFSHAPEVLAGARSVDQAARDFMKQWDRHDCDGTVTLDEFEDYYKDISASIDDDDYFELMIRNAWRIAGGEGAAANTANKRVLVTGKDGKQQVVTVNNELGMVQGKGKDAVADIQKRLAQQGIDASNIELFGGMDTTEKPKKQGNKPGVSKGPSAVSRDRNPMLDGDDSPLQRAPPARARNPMIDGDGSPMAAAPRQAWSENPGAQVSNRPRRGVSSGGGAKAKVSSAEPISLNVFVPSEAIRRILYSPPTNIEGLAQKLQVSTTMSAPTIPQKAFAQRMVTLDKTLTREQIALMWEEFCPAGETFINLEKMYEKISEKFGKDKSASKSGSVLDKVIAKILERCGGGGLKGLQRTISIMDDNGDKRLSKEELKTGLQDYGIILNIRELDDIFTAFDRDRNGFIDVDEFLIACKGDLSERRKRCIRMAFDCLDKDKSGEITVDEMIAAYNFEKDPEVAAGNKSVNQAARDFMKQWDRFDSDGLVSYEEFEDYYKAISAGIDGDDYFELMIRNAWRIAGGEGAAANTANKRVLVTGKDGKQQVVTVNNELGMVQGKGKDAVADIQKRLAQQGIDASNIELFGGMDTTEKPKKQGNKPGVSKGLPAAAKTSIGVKPISKSAVEAHNPVERHMAALKVAAAFRGKVARKKSEYEKRKKIANDRMQQGEIVDQNRPRPPKIIRPKGKSYIGF